MPCAITQGNILGCNEGFGGIKSIYLANASDVTYTLTAGVITAITKLTGKRFFKYELTPFTADANFEATSSRENGSNEVKQMIAIVINKQTGALRKELNDSVSKANLKAIVIDNNGIAWMYGQENGLYAPTIKGSTGKAYKDRNGYEIALETMEKEMPLLVTDTLIASLETPGT